MDATDWLRQLQAMMAHDVSAHTGGDMEAAAKRVRAKMLVVIASEDHMVNPMPARAFARAAGVPVLELNGDCGHLAPGCEAAALNSAVAAFLK